MASSAEAQGAIDVTTVGDISYFVFQSESNHVLTTKSYGKSWSIPSIIGPARSSTPVASCFQGDKVLVFLSFFFFSSGKNPKFTHRKLILSSELYSAWVTVISSETTTSMTKMVNGPKGIFTRRKLSSIRTPASQPSPTRTGYVFTFKPILGTFRKSLDWIREPGKPPVPYQLRNQSWPQLYLLAMVFLEYFMFTGKTAPSIGVTRLRDNGKVNILHVLSIHRYISRRLKFKFPS